MCIIIYRKNNKLILDCFKSDKKSINYNIRNKRIGNSNNSKRTVFSWFSI